DDVEYVAGRRLILERRLQRFRPRLHLLEQPRVFNGDNGLVGEGLQQFYFIVGERSGIGAPDVEDTNRCAFPHHGYPNATSHTQRAGYFSMTILWVGLNIRYVDHLAIQNSSTHAASSGRGHRKYTMHQLIRFRAWSWISGDPMEQLSVELKERIEKSIAQFARVRGDRVENRLDVCG